MVIPILALLLSASCLADEVPNPKPNPVSVYEIQPVTDGVIIGATTLGAVLPIAFQNHLVYIPPAVHAYDVNPLDRHVIGMRNIFIDNTSDIAIGVILAAPVGLDYLDVGWTHVYAEDMVVYAQTMSINGFFTTLFKFTVQRPAPRVYAGTDPSWNTTPTGYLSFYSGHTAFAFAALSAASMTLDLRHDAGVWPWIVTVALGTGIAAARVAAGEHFYTDVGVGAMMGTTVGVLVPLWHKRVPEVARHVGLMPTGDGAELTWNTRF